MSASADPTEPAPSAPGPQDPGAVVTSLRAFLKHETDRLRSRQATGLGGLEIAAARSAVIDQVVTRACRAAGGA